MNIISEESTKIDSNLWDIQLELAIELRRVCEKYNIQYFMTGGTLLGAVRHKGFIPWDDDMDFAFTRKEYNKLKKVAKEEFKGKFVFQCPESEEDIYFGGFARLINADTTYIITENLYKKSKCGLWIDIIILDFVEDDCEKATMQFDKIRHHQRLLYAKVYEEQVNFLEVGKSLWDKYKLEANDMLKDEICEKINHYSTICKNTKYVTSFTYKNNKYAPIKYSKNCYDEVVYLDFMGNKFPAPKGYDELLKTQYGENYMEIPDNANKVTTHGNVIFDIKNSIEYYKCKYGKKLSHECNDIDISGKKVVFFGTGHDAKNYLDSNPKIMPNFFVDNFKEKWGTYLQGIEIKSPKEIYLIPKEERVVIVCTSFFSEISKQLINNNVDEFYLYTGRRSDKTLGAMGLEFVMCTKGVPIFY